MGRVKSQPVNVVAHDIIDDIKIRVAGIEKYCDLRTQDEFLADLEGLCNMVKLAIQSQESVGKE